jgi:hypothetical protein
MVAGVVWITLHLSNVDESLLCGYKSLEKRKNMKWGGEWVKKLEWKVVMFMWEEEDRLHDHVSMEDFRLFWS